MIVPRNRLLLLTALLLLPAAFLYAATPTGLYIFFCLLAGLVVAAVFDLMLSLGQIRNIEVCLGNEDSDVTRFSRDREGVLPLCVMNHGGETAALQLGIAFPAALNPKMETMRTSVAPGKNWLQWPCIPRKRGLYQVKDVRLQRASVLGLWDMRRKQVSQTEIRVYPNLMSERNKMAALFLNRGNVGMHAQRQVGKGREFEKLREYIPGDSYEDIHWKATARRGHPVTKVFQLERTQEVYVVVDSSRLSGRLVKEPGTGKMVSQLDRFLTAALVLGLVCEKQGDLFGLVTFSNKIQSFIRARNGRAHYNACRDALYTLEPRQMEPDFEELFSFLHTRLRRRALVLFLTNLDDPVLAEQYASHINLIARRHLVMVNMITPAGIAPLFSENVQSEQDIYQALAGHLQWKDLRELKRSLQHRGVSLNFSENATLTPDLVSQYMSIKQRQLL